MDAARPEETIHDAAHVVEQLAEGLEENVRRGAEQARSALGALNSQFGSFVHESPLLAIASAFAVGWAVAKMARTVR